MRNSGSPVKPCVWIWINPINLLNQLNHPKGVCFLYKQVPAERLSGLSGDFNF